MVKDSNRIQFLALYNRVFEPDGITIKNCSNVKNASIDLMLFCNIIAPHKLPEDESSECEYEYPELEKILKNDFSSLGYYGNLKTGIMNFDRIHALYLELTNPTI